MYQFSDSDSSDSEDGIRYKTESTRNKVKQTARANNRIERKSDLKYSRTRSPSTERSSYRSSHRDRGRREKSRSLERSRRRSRSRSSQRDVKSRISKSNSPRNEISHRVTKSKHKKNRSRSRSRSKTNLNKQNDETIIWDHKKKHKQEHRKHRKSKKEEDKNTQIIDAVKPEAAETNPQDTEVIKLNLVENTLPVNNEDSGSKDVLSQVPEVIEKDDESPDVLGPMLPPHLLNKSINEENSEEIVSVTPSLRRATETAIISDEQQILQSNKQLMVVSDDQSTRELSSEPLNELTSIGPALPPHLLNKTKENEKFKNDESAQIGPTLPAHLREQLSIAANEDEIESEEDEDVYGPLPPGMATKSKAQVALEERALQMKIDSMNPSEEKPEREEWMMELPGVKAPSLGFGPRQFRKNAAPDMSDRSSWTDTPELKAKKSAGKVDVKVDLKKEAETLALQKHDQEQEAMLKKHKKKKKDKSLLEQHQVKLEKKKKKDKESGTSERRPFSRDIDLKVNKFDEAQKKAILKKAQLLDDRFSKGQSKYL